MLKDATRDYVVNMFRFYASLNSPSKEEIYLHRNELTRPQLLDLLAVEKAFNEFSPEMKNAVKCIYFVRPTDKLHKGEISARVINYSTQHYLGENTVWKYLKQARVICAKCRELNTC